MSDLLDRLRALRGDAGAARDDADEAGGAAPGGDPHFLGPAAQLGAETVTTGHAVHLVRRARLAHGARHGGASLGGGGLHPWLGRWAARHEPDAAPGAGEGPPGRVVYLDTETTGLAGGTGTYAFLVGLGVHDDDGFAVEQLFLPGPEHEPAYLEALARRLTGAAAVVSYNGASFDLPLVRTRFALHGMPDPLAGVPHLDLLPLARRLWRSRLPDCTLGTVEREVLGARRSGRDVPGAEVPARYLAFLRSRDARPLRGVIEHNQDDVVALAAMRTRIEAALAHDVASSAPEAAAPRAPAAAEPDELVALARWLEAMGEHDAALARYHAAEHVELEAARGAARLLRRKGRHDEAAQRWAALAEAGDPRGWIELAKHREHRLGDLEAALAAVEAARRCGGERHDDLERRRARLAARRAARAGDDA